MNQPQVTVSRNVPEFAKEDFLEHSEEGIPKLRPRAVVSAQLKPHLQAGFFKKATKHLKTNTNRLYLGTISN